MSAARAPKEFLPLSQTNYRILESLIDGPKHGYAIIKDVDKRSGGEFELAVGNLYVALKRLLDDGLIERAEEPSVEGGRQRNTFKVSSLGEEVFQAETQRLATLLRT